MSAILRAAMLEMCDRRHGQLSQVEIDHVFDLVMNSTELFSIFQRGYSNCVGLKNSPQFVQVDETSIIRFVVGSYCRDVMSGVFEHQIGLRGTAWSRAFVDGFIVFLTEVVDQDLPHDLFVAYQKIATQFAGSLTPITILNAEDTVKVFGKTSSRLHAKLHDDPATAARLETTANEALARALKLTGPAQEKLNSTTCSAFIRGLSTPPSTNPFRSLVLNNARET